MESIGRRLAILETEDAEKWSGYTEALWRAALEEPGDNFTVFKAHAGQIPSADEASAFDALIIAGSHYSVNDDAQWINDLASAVAQYAQRGVRMYGCCFGAQMLARSLGGKVGPNPSGAFVLGVEQITPCPALAQLHELHAVVRSALLDDDTGARTSKAAAAAADALNGMCLADSSGADAISDGGAVHSSGGAAEDPSNTDSSSSSSSSKSSKSSVLPGFKLVESHGEQVLSLPTGALLLASSPSARCELWSWGDNVLAGQFHPELNASLTLEKIWTPLSAAGRLGSPAAAAAARASLAAGNDTDSRPMLQVIQHFLRHGLGGSPSQQQQQQQQHLLSAIPAPSCTPLPSCTAGAVSATAAAAAILQSQSPPRPPLRLEDSAAASLGNSQRRSSTAVPHCTAAAAAAAAGATDGTSGSTSPTAASEHSVGTAITSMMSGALPFSAIAAQRHAAQRQAELSEAATRLLQDAGGALDARMHAARLELAALTAGNEAAAAAYGNAAEMAAALGQFAGDLMARQAALRDALAALPALDKQLGILEGAVSAIDSRARELETQLGLTGGSSGSVASTAYEYIAASLGRGGSAVVGACLGGGGGGGGGTAAKRT